MTSPMMMQNLCWRILLLGLLAGLSLPNAAPAQESQSIVAIVNNDVISDYDLEQRVRLFYVNANLSPSTNPQAQAQLRASILDDLIEEILKAQETKRVGITVQNAQIIAMLSELAQRNNMDLIQLEEFVQSRDINLRTLYLQAEHRLAWDAFVQRGLGVRIVIGDLEVEERLQQLMSSRNKTRYLLREILLPYGYEFDRARVEDLGTNLVNELRRGADFRSLAQRFSFAPSAALGGDIGWVTLDQINAELRTEVESMRIGDISNLIFTKADGAYILQLLSQEQYGQPNPLRDQFELLRFQISAPELAAPTEAPLVQPDAPKRLWSNLFPRPEEPDLAPTTPPTPDITRFDSPLTPPERKALDERLEAFVQRYTNCDTAPELAQTLGITEFNQVGPIALGALGHSYQDAIINLQEGDLSAPIARARSYEVFAVCRRVDDRGTQINAELARRQLFNERLQLRITQRIRELRRRATIDVRLDSAS